MSQAVEPSAPRIMVAQSSWGVWFVRTVITVIMCIASTGATAWIVGDRLLTHAFAGFNAALETTNSSVEAVRGEVVGLRGDMNVIGTNAVDRFLETLKETSRIEVQLTGDFAAISGEIRELRTLIQHQTDEQSRLIQLVEDIHSRK